MSAPDDTDLAAAELALGVLEGEERSAALRRVLADPAFAREVERWRRHFAALFAEMPEVAPPADLGRRIDATTADPGRAVRRWRLVAMAAGIAAVLLLGVVLLRPGAPASVRTPVAKPVELLAAVLTPKDGAPVAAIVDPSAGEVRLRGALFVAPGRDAELWLIGADGVPHAAGIVPRGVGRAIRLRRGVTVQDGVTLAVSIEPVGGSSRATPTGPVVASGTLAPV